MQTVKSTCDGGGHLGVWAGEGALGQVVQAWTSIKERNEDLVGSGSGSGGKIWLDQHQDLVGSWEYQDD